MTTKTDVLVRLARKGLPALHSALVRAAVAVANIGLRGRITMHDSVESLLAARSAAR